MSRGPIQIGRDICPIAYWVFEMLDWTLLISSQTISENSVSRSPDIVFRSQASIIFKNIRISSCSIALIIESCSFFGR